MIEVIEPTSYIWKPNPGRQELFFSLPDSIFERFYGGAAGGGKSEAILNFPIIKGFYKHPKFKGIIFRRTYPQLEESLIARIKEPDSLYSLVGGKYNAQDHVCTFPSGATIRFSYLERDEDARDHDTAEYHYAGFDELTHFTRWQYTYITSRVRSTIPSLPAIVCSASNPGNIGHAWVRERFVEPHRDGMVLLHDAVTRQYRIFIPAKLQDNPRLLENDPTYLNRLSLLPEAERRAKAEGDWWVFAGQVFVEFRAQKFSDEPENALHVVDPFPIPGYWPKVLAIDWGYTAMTWAGLFGLSPDEVAFLYAERTFYKTSIANWASSVAQMCQFEDNLMTIVMDPSAWKHDGQELSIAEQFMKHSGLYGVERADNDRISGKMLLHDLLRWGPKPPRYIPPGGFDQDTFDRVYRIKGQKVADEYLALFQPEPPETNLPKLRIFRTCPEVIQAIQTCVYDEKRVEDVKQWNGDDPYDGLRYGAKALERYLDSAKIGERKEMKIAKAMEAFEKTGDYFSLHRRMEKLESTMRTNVISFRRNHTYPGNYRRQKIGH